MTFRPHGQLPTSTWPDAASYSLGHRYTARAGVDELTGLQAVVRMLLDRSGIDAHHGLRTGVFVSGYPGSPLAGLDLELGRRAELLAAANVVHLPAVNEELGATAVAGTQLLDKTPGARVDGVLGVCYGKAPGIDRAGDALKHGNFIGAHPRGGVLALAGDDPTCKSSSLPSASEVAFYDALMPVVFPSSPQDVLDAGQHAIELSRASGLWVGMKLVTAVVDGFSTVELLDGTGWSSTADEIPGAYGHSVSGRLLPPDTLAMERDIHERRLPIAREYGYRHGLNPTVVSSAGDSVGIVAAGQTYRELTGAFGALGLTDDELRRLGIRVLKVTLPYPMDPRDITTFAAGLQTLVVVEDKRPFVELFVKDALYGVTDAPAVLGKLDRAGQPLLPSTGALDATTIGKALRAVLGERLDLPQPRESLTLSVRQPLPMLPQRQPYYCPGCPHSRSTKVPAGSVVGAGIGCHAMAQWMPEDQYGGPVGMTQMGGEGAWWLGIAPFSDTDHFVQNLGDGTFFHSAHLAVRAAVAAGAHVTFKLLYNDAMGMTGGQHVPGERDVATLARLLLAEGVTRVIVTTEDLGRYRRRRPRLPRGVPVRHRDRLDEVQQELKATPGVTVLIHDQACAAEARRLRKRGLIPDPPTRVVINPRVCEGCGDCHRASNCLALETIDTDYGPKTAVQQSACNKDYSCLLGDCPSFVTVQGDPPRRPVPGEPPAVLTESAPHDRVTRIRMPGVGGTGVVTVNQVLATAAVLDGRHVVGLDQTGLAQKGGPVVSDLIISPAALVEPGKLSPGDADVYLALDALVGLTEANLATCRSDHTVAVVNTTASTAGSTLGQAAAMPSPDGIRAAIDAVTTPQRNVYADAGALAVALFGDHMPTNTFLLGIAFQLGLLPVTAASVERAIELNGASVAMNLAAFRWGRAYAVDPNAVTAATGLAAPLETPAAFASELAARALAPLDEAPRAELVQRMARRASDLADYQSRGYAERYADVIGRVAAAEAGLDGAEPAVTSASIDGLYKLMAYKDEYEVARLHLDPAFRQHVAAAVSDPRKLRWHLHPPMLRAAGLRKKMRLGRSAPLAFGVLRAMRRVRGRWVDPFGHTAMRRLERDLIREYVDVLDDIARSLDDTNHEVAAEIAALPDLVRGYEEVKLANVTAYRSRLAELQQLRAPQEVMR